MPHWNTWSIYWLLWLAIGFCVPEFWALGTGHPENTLSEQVWHLTGQTGAAGTAHWTFAHFVVAAFCVWLAGHFVFHWWH